MSYYIRCQLIYKITSIHIISIEKLHPICVMLLIFQRRFRTLSTVQDLNLRRPHESWTMIQCISSHYNDFTKTQGMPHKYRMPFTNIDLVSRKIIKIELFKLFALIEFVLPALHNCWLRTFTDDLDSDLLLEET